MFFFGFTSGGNIGAVLKLYGLGTAGWAGSAGSFMIGTAPDLKSYGHVCGPKGFSAEGGGNATLAFFLVSIKHKDPCHPNTMVHRSRL